MSVVDRVGEDESHPLASLMEVIGILIENYETEHIPQLLQTIPIGVVTAIKMIWERKLVTGAVNGER